MTDSARNILRPAEFAQLRQLSDRLGVTRLADALDLPFYICRSLLNLQRVSDRTRYRVRAYLPKLVAGHLTNQAPPPKRRPPPPLRVAGGDIRMTLAALFPYVSAVRLAGALGLSLNTMNAAAAGYRRMHVATAEMLRSRLDDLLQPPHDALRATLRVTTPGSVLQGLRVGMLAPIPGLTAEQTERLLLKP